MKKPPAPEHGSMGDAQDGSKNLFKNWKTGAERARKHRQLSRSVMKQLSAVLGDLTKADGKKKPPSTPDLLRIATARLESLGKSNPVADFEFAVATYLRELNWEPGNTIPVDSFWEQLLGLVDEQNPELAQTFAKDFKPPFIWCFVGHVHRLNMEYNQRPEAIQTIEIYTKGNKRTFIGLRRDGNRVLLAVPDYPRMCPWVCFAGTRARPLLSPGDFKRLERMDPKRAVELMGSGKFKFTYPPDALLFPTDTVLNVAMPRDLARVRAYFRTFSFKPSRNYRKT